MTALRILNIDSPILAVIPSEAEGSNPASGIDPEHRHRSLGFARDDLFAPLFTGDLRNASSNLRFPINLNQDKQNQFPLCTKSIPGIAT